MLRDALSLFAKTDLSRLDGSDLGRFASILRDSVAFDARSGLRSGRRLARRGGSYVIEHKREAGIGLGGLAALGLAGYAAYKLYQAKQPQIEAAVADATDAASETVAELKVKTKAKVDEVAA